MSRSEHHEKDTVHVALFVSFVSWRRSLWFCALSSWRRLNSSGDWRLGKDVTTQGRHRFAFVSTFICGKLYHRMTVLCQTHSEALPVQRWASTACWRGGPDLASGGLLTCLISVSSYIFDRSYPDMFWHVWACAVAAVFTYVCQVFPWWVGGKRWQAFSK